MTRVILMRHGTGPSNRTGHYAGWSAEGLNEAGREAVVALAAPLNAWRINAAYSSDLARAWQSAELLLAEISVAPPLTVMPALRGANMGDWTGKTWDEVQETDPERVTGLVEDSTAIAPPGGESRRMVQERVVGAVRKLLAGHLPNATVLLVTHATPIQMLLCDWFNLPPQHYWRWRIDPASLTVCDVYNAGVILEQLNWRPDLLAQIRPEDRTEAHS